MPQTQRSIRILYFAWVREHVGHASEDVALPDEVVTVAELIQHLKSRGPHYEAAFRRPEVIRAALDQRHVKSGTAIGEAREVAFFPPVTGG